ncbi:hypothetical protein GGF41_006556, partial [Coemansia sp. RSA 2531]
EKDDVGNAGSPFSNTGDSNSSGGGSSKTDSSDKEESGSESGSSSKNSSSTMLAVQPLATLLTSAVALFYLF